MNSLGKYMESNHSLINENPPPKQNLLQEVKPEMVEFMAKLRERITIGVVGGSDLPKQKEQLGESGEGALLYFRLQRSVVRSHHCI